MSMYTKDQFINDPDTTIGAWTYGGISVERAYCGCRLDVGKFCSIGSGVRAIFWGKHSMVDITTYPFNMLHGRGWPSVQCTEVLPEHITIGNDVWIANHVTIMQGAKVGDGAVLGAFSVVKGRIPPYSIVAGNPAKEFRQRFTGVQIEKLLCIKWWNWPEDMIKKHLAVINSPDVEQLYEIWKSEIKQ